MLEELQSIRTKLKFQHGGTFQNALYLKMVATKETDVYNGFEHDHQRLHFKTIQDDVAAKWLQVYPRYTDLQIGNNTFTINLNLRYLLDIPDVIVCVNKHGNACPYCRKAVDLTGHHFINGCSKDIPQVTNTGSQFGAQFHATHDYVRHTLAGCCQHALSFCMEEPQHMFLDADSSKRPDVISEFTINNVFVRHALDLTL